MHLFTNNNIAPVVTRLWAVAQSHSRCSSTDGGRLLMEAFYTFLIQLRHCTMHQGY